MSAAEFSHQVAQLNKWHRFLMLLFLCRLFIAQEAGKIISRFSLPGYALARIRKSGLK